MDISIIRHPLNAIRLYLDSSLFSNGEEDWVRDIQIKAKAELPSLQNTSVPLNANEKKKVLFWTMSPWSYMVIDCILATALRLRGHETIMIVCDGLDFCEVDQYNIKASDHGKRCSECLKRTLRYINAFSLEWKPLSLFAPKELFDEVYNFMGLVKDSRSVIVDNIKIGDLAGINAGYYSGIPGTLWPLMDKNVIKSYLFSGYVLTKAAKDILANEKPDIIVTTGGKTITWAPIFELAKMMGLGATNWEDYSVHPNGFVFSHDQPAVRGYLNDIWKVQKELDLTDEQKKELWELFSAWKKGEATPYQYYKAPEESSDRILKQLGISRDKKIVAIFPNILREDNMLQGNAAFANQIEWISAIINLAKADNEKYYILRAHPAENTLPASYIMNRLLDILAQLGQPLPENFILISPESNISSYKLGEMADVIMVWTGTLGLEFSMNGRRVIVAGEPGYRNKGFTYDLVKDSDLNKRIEDASSNKFLTLGEIKYAERYAYLIRFRTLVKFPYHSSHKTRTFSIPSFRELAPGGNQIIDDLCNCIIYEKPFIDIGIKESRT